MLGVSWTDSRWKLPRSVSLAGELARSLDIGRILS
jgi:hypothetical protein